jgi:Ras-related protein Rab-28
MPYLSLIGNKTDLFHMQSVKLDKHNAFAELHSMYSYLVSAKTGDQVFTSFYRIAADLSGVVLTTNDIESSQKVIKAEIITYANEEKPPVQAIINPEPPKQQTAKKKRKCVVF